ncbi:MAG: heme-binding protein [Gammaproteobacteria bacterium]
MRPMFLFLILLFGFFRSEAVMAIEEPEYRVIATSEDYEIREYQPYVVAETTVSGSLRSSGGKAFRILAGYIFGKNGKQEKMQMTAPVESRPIELGNNVSTARSDGKSGFTYGFVMESKYDLESLPRPMDERITLREVPARRVAARTFSGTWSNGNYEKNERALLSALTRDARQPVDAPMLARYDGPMTPWFMRRNEVLVELAPES